MGAEIGATTSTFGYDEKMAQYLRGTGRQKKLLTSPTA
jgi:aconitate hydratase